MIDDPRISEIDPEFERLLREEKEIELETHLQHAHSAIRQAWDDRSARLFDQDQTIAEQADEITRHHKDFGSISALCTLWRNERLSAEEALTRIQNIVG